MNKIKLIALDVDGTVMAKGKVNDADKKALARAKANGIKVTIATGRAPKAVYSVMQKLDIVSYDTPIISSNGGQVFFFNPDKTVRYISNVGFIKGETDSLFHLAKDHGITLYCYTQDDDLAYANRRFHHFIFYMSKRSDRKLVKYKFNEKQLSPICKIIAFGSRKTINQYRVEVEALGFPAFGYSYSSKARANIEIAPKGMDKRTALVEVAEQLSIKQSEVMYFGDGENDREAIKWAGIGVAMGNAKDHVKELADVVTDSQAKAGVAKQINAYLDNLKNN